MIEQLRKEKDHAVFNRMYGKKISCCVKMKGTGSDWSISYVGIKIHSEVAKSKYIIIGNDLHSWVGIEREGAEFFGRQRLQRWWRCGVGIVPMINHY